MFFISVRDIIVRRGHVRSTCVARLQVKSGQNAQSYVPANASAGSLWKCIALTRANLLYVYLNFQHIVIRVIARVQRYARMDADLDWYYYVLATSFLEHTYVILSRILRKIKVHLGTALRPMFSLFMPVRNESHI